MAVGEALPWAAATIFTFTPAVHIVVPSKGVLPSLTNRQGLIVVVPSGAAAGKEIRTSKVRSLPAAEEEFLPPR